jgi:head-tail adaptor
MDTGKLNRFITIQTLISTEVDGHSSESWSDADTVRASVVQVDGSRYLKEEELIDRAVYKIICWDNGYSDNIRIGLGSENLFPIRPITRNPGSSNLNEIVIVAATKTSNILTA